MCGNGQSFRRDVMEFKLLTTICTELLSDASVERFKSKLVRRLRRANVDTGRIRPPARNYQHRPCRR